MNKLKEKYNLYPYNKVEAVYNYPDANHLESINKKEQTPEMVQLVCSHDGMALKYASKKLITREVCEIAVNQNGLALQYVPPRLFVNSSGEFDFDWAIYICTIAVSNNGCALQYIPQEFSAFEITTYGNDIYEKIYSIYETALHQNGISMEFVPQNMIDMNLATCAITHFKNSNGEAGGELDYFHKYPIYYIPSVYHTEELLMNAVRYSPFCIRDINVDKELYKTLVEIAISQNGDSLRYVKPSYISKKLAQIAISNSATAIRYVPKRYKTQQNYIDCFNRNYIVFRYTPPEFITEEMCLSVISLGKFQVFSRHIRHRNFMTEESFVEFDNIPEDLRNNEKVLAAIIADDENNIRRLLRWHKENEESKPLRDSTVSYLLSLIKPEPAQNNTDSSLVDSISLTSPLNKYSLITEAPSNKYTLVKKNNSQLITHFFSEDEYASRNIYYISDIHLEHQFFKEFVNLYKMNLDTAKKEIAISKLIDKQIEHMLADIHHKDDIILVGGDIANSIGLTEEFYKLLAERWDGTIIAVLGNHELWDGTGPNEWDDPTYIPRSVENIINDYKQLKVFQSWRNYLLENEIYIELINGRRLVLSEEDIINSSVEDLKEILSEATVIILGGIGYSGLNTEYNPMLGIYRKTISTTEEDKARSLRFKNVHDKVKECATDKNVIVLTHSQVENWTSEECVKNWIYVNGHTHNNTIRIKDNVKILSDNQIGYAPKKWMLHSFTVDCWYDPFENYEDGIHIITSDQYKNFNLGRGISNNGCNFPGKLYLLKKNGSYLFLLKSAYSLSLMAGGQRRRLNNQSVKYYYDNMDRYCEKLLQIIKPYKDVMEMLSREVIKFGGDGTIHGSIIDISWYSHLYVNPYDGKITPYWAYGINGRLPYKNLLDLLLSQEPEMVETFKLQCEDNQLPLIDKYIMKTPAKIKDAKMPKWVWGTEIYKPSRILRSIQYVWQQNVIRIWNDEILNTNDLALPKTDLIENRISIEKSKNKRTDKKSSCEIE